MGHSAGVSPSEYGDPGCKYCAAKATDPAAAHRQRITSCSDARWRPGRRQRKHRRWLFSKGCDAPKRWYARVWCPMHAGGSPRRERSPLEPGPLSAAAPTRSRADSRKSRRKTCKTMGEDIGIEPLTQRTLPKP